MASGKEGATLGPYRIMEQIGLGGMATVYKAYQPAMDRYVAIKVLPQHYAQDPTFVERFLREAKTIARLEHRNILPVYDFGEDRNITYMAMRYLEGGTLKEIMQMGRLSLADAGRLLRQVADALDYAHRQGVVHRDVKPANIMVDDEGWAYVTDFGIAKVLEVTSELTGGAIGTPAYMAPEQAQGLAVDGRTDIYALGVILYEMATGSPPYSADTPMAVALKHIHEPLPIPSAVDPSIPDEVERVILKSLAKDPADRHESAADFSEALREAIDEAGVDQTQTRVETLAEEARISRMRITSPVTEDSFTDPMMGAGAQEMVHAEDDLPSGTYPAPPPATIQAQKRQPVWLWPLIAVLGIAVIAGAILVGTGVLGGRDRAADEAPADTADASEPSDSGSEQDSDQQEQESEPGAPIMLPETRWRRRLDFCGPGLCVYDRDGALLATALEDSDLEGFTGLTWSPDGSQIAFAAFPRGSDPSEQYRIYIMPAVEDAEPRQLEAGLNALDPAWSPNGEWIAMHDAGRLAAVRPDGSDYRILFGEDGVCVNFPQWSPDSTRIVANVGDCSGPEQFVAVFQMGEREPTIVGTLESNDFGGLPGWAFSPNGRQVAYQVAPGGDVFVTAASGSDERHRVAEFPYGWTSAYWPQWGRQSASQDELLIADDFEDQNFSEWWRTGYPDVNANRYWSIVTESEDSDNHVAQVSPTEDEFEVMLSVHEWPVNNYAISYRFRLMESIPQAAVEDSGQITRIRTGGDCNYAVIFREGTNNFWRDGDCPDNEAILTWEGISPNTWYDVRLEAYENTISIYLDGEQIIQFEDQLASLSGPFRIGSSNYDVQFDDIQVWALEEAEGSDTLGTFEIVATVGGWVNTDILLEAGQAYTITATGSVSFCEDNIPACDEWGPTGIPNVSTPREAGEPLEFYPLPDEQNGALVGRIGESGDPFLIGEGTTLTASTNGMLWLNLNEWPPDNNSGSFTVTVRQAAE